MWFPGHSMTMWFILGIMYKILFCSNFKFQILFFSIFFFKFHNSKLQIFLEVLNLKFPYLVALRKDLNRSTTRSLCNYGFSSTIMMLNVGQELKTMIWEQSCRLSLLITRLVAILAGLTLCSICQCLLENRLFLSQNCISIGQTPLPKGKKIAHLIGIWLVCVFLLAPFNSTITLFS